MQNLPAGGEEVFAIGAEGHALDGDVLRWGEGEHLIPGAGAQQANSVVRDLEREKGAIR